MIMSFVDAMRGEGHAVESTCRVLSDLGVQVAARTYRVSWAGYAALGAQLLAMAYVMKAIHRLAFAWDSEAGCSQLRPEGLYGRRKMTAALRRAGHEVSYGRVHEAMTALGHNGFRRGRRHRTTIPGKNGNRARDLLNRDFTAATPNTKWVTDFTYVRTWAGFVYVAFVVNCFSQRVISWHADATKVTDLVITPLRMANWERDRQGHPIERGHLIHHNDPLDPSTTPRCG